MQTVNRTNKFESQTYICNALKKLMELVSY